MNNTQFKPNIAWERDQCINGVDGLYMGATMRENEAPGCFASQRWVASKVITYDGHKNCLITVRIRWDDDCRNGHNSFSITGDIKTSDLRLRPTLICGCIHSKIAKYFPALEPLIKWHLFDSTGPMHYVANTLYWADAHEANRAWVYYTGQIDPLGIGKQTEHLLGYMDREQALQAYCQPGYRVQWDEKTAKERNLEHARNTAVWSDATDEQLCLPKEELQQLLEARLPALLAEFKAMIESCGFLWERV